MPLLANSYPLSTTNAKQVTQYPPVSWGTSRQASQPQPPAGGGGNIGGADVARGFNGSSNRIVLSPGAFSGAPFDYGTMVAIFRYTSDADWQDIFHFNTGSAESGVLEIAPWGQLWNAWTDSTGSYCQTLTSGTSYCVVITKASGSAIPRFHVFNFTTQTWNHANGDIAQSNPTANVTSVVIGAYPGNFDWNADRISACAGYRHWVPNDAAVEAVGFQLDIDNWIS